LKGVKTKKQLLCSFSHDLSGTLLFKKNSQRLQIGCDKHRTLYWSRKFDVKHIFQETNIPCCLWLYEPMFPSVTSSVKTILNKQTWSKILREASKEERHGVLKK